MRIRGAEKLSAAELDQALVAGGRCVVFEYCVSLVIVTSRRPSDMYFLGPGERGFWRGLPFALISLVLGWWGVPWGVVHTPLVLVTDLSGGRDVPLAVRARLRPPAEADPA